jgi:hypothetical protein
VTADMIDPRAMSISQSERARWVGEQWRCLNIESLIQLNK